MNTELFQLSSKVFNDENATTNGPYDIQELEKRWNAGEGCILLCWQVMPASDPRALFGLKDLPVDHPDRDRLRELESLRLPWLEKTAGESSNEEVSSDQ